MQRTETLRSTCSCFAASERPKQTGAEKSSWICVIPSGDGLRTDRSDVVVTSAFTDASDPCHNHKDMVAASAGRRVFCGISEKSV